MNIIVVKLNGLSYVKSCLYIVSVRQPKTLKLMSKKKKPKKTNANVQSVLEQQQQQTEINKTLIFGGILVAMSSIGLLIFVLSDKVFHLSYYF